MKKIVLSLLLAAIVLGLGAGWVFFGPATSFRGKKYDLYIRTGMDYETLLDSIRQNDLLSFPAAFNWLARRADYPNNIKAGKYEIKSGTSLPNILRMLRNGRQTPVNLVITKLRTKEDFAGLVGRKFECDSLAFIHFLNNADSVRRYGVDTSTVMTLVIPDTYTYYWNTTPSRIFRKIDAAHDEFWTSERKEKAAQHHLSPQSAYILASIVEEETNQRDDKGKIASVYINRLATGMHLGADPTVKFAMRNFELKRIYSKYLKVESPYNTYENAGLPPGPICTPTAETIDAVIQSPVTKYFYFVAKPGYAGYSNFAETFQEHMVFARSYQAFLDSVYKVAQAHQGSTP